MVQELTMSDLRLIRILAIVPGINLHATRASLQSCLVCNLINFKSTDNSTRLLKFYCCLKLVSSAHVQGKETGWVRVPIKVSPYVLQMRSHTIDQRVGRYCG